MPFDEHDQLEPVRKTVSAEFVEDPRILSDAVARSVRELYLRAAGEGLRVLGWRAEFGRNPGSMYGEAGLVVSATEIRRERLGLTVAQMDAEIMGLLSRRRDD